MGSWYMTSTLTYWTIRHALTHCHSHTHIPHTVSHILSHIVTITYIITDIHSQSHTHTITHMHTLSVTYTYIQCYTHTYIHTHTHTHTHTIHNFYWLKLLHQSPAKMICCSKFSNPSTAFTQCLTEASLNSLNGACSSFGLAFLWNSHCPTGQ